MSGVCAFLSHISAPSLTDGHTGGHAVTRHFGVQIARTGEEYLGALFQTAEDFRVGRIGNTGLNRYKLIILRNTFGTLGNRQGFLKRSFPFSSVSGG